MQQSQRTMHRRQPVTRNNLAASEVCGIMRNTRNIRTIANRVNTFVFLMRRRESDFSGGWARGFESPSNPTIERRNIVIARRCTDKARLHLDRNRMTRDGNRELWHVRKRSTDQSRRLLSSLLILFINFLFLFSLPGTQLRRSPRRSEMQPGSGIRANQDSPALCVFI